MAGDWYPPGVHDDSPLPADPAFLAGVYARQLRAAAGEFRRAGPRDRTGPGDESDTRRKQTVGRILIAAFDRGLVPGDDFKPIRDAIAFHRDPDGPPCDGTPPTTRRARGPYNLFIDLAGGYRGRARYPRAGDPRVLDPADRPDPGEVSGGLLPRYSPVLLAMSEHERAAAACELLADILESGPRPPTAPAPVAPLPALMAASDLADRLGRPLAAVETFLRRFRATSEGCFVEVDTGVQNEPKYLYRTAVVWPALQGWVGQTGG